MELTVSPLAEKVHLLRGGLLKSVLKAQSTQRTARCQRPQNGLHLVSAAVVCRLPSLTGAGPSQGSLQSWEAFLSELLVTAECLSSANLTMLP